MTKKKEKKEKESKHFKDLLHAQSQKRDFFFKKKPCPRLHLLDS
jgi:hypothetical protein